MSRLTQYLEKYTFRSCAKKEFATKLVNDLDVEWVSNYVITGNNLIPTIVRKLSGILITERIILDVFVEKYGDIFGKFEVVLTDDLTATKMEEFFSRKETLLGLGGGRVMDILKYIQLKSGAHCIAIPSSLTTHVYASPKIHALPLLKELGETKTVDGPIPDLAILDIPFLEELQSKNVRLIRAGLGDIMAYLTALNDWQLAQNAGKDKTNSEIIAMGQFTIDTLKRLDVNLPLQQWIKDYVLIQVLLCEISGWVGSPPVSGSEHLFAKEAEEGLAQVPLHGELVALGTLIMTKVQGGDVSVVADLMKTLQLPTSLGEIGVTKEQVISAMQRCREYGRHKDRYTVVEKVELTEDYCRNIVDDLISARLIT
jgi:glycerol-1-phosphate dehydrogenase [NAD(P)+]